MADNKAPAAEGAADKPKKQKPAQDAYSAPKRKKQEWTQERCVKAAKRFDSVEAWKQGAPASFKAADAHGWVQDCAKHMTGGVKKPSFRKSA